MGKVYNDPDAGAIFVEDTDGSLVWSTQRAPVNLLPEADWIEINNQTIAFPDFNKFINYGHVRWWEPDPNPWASDSGDVCQTITMIEPEERTLSDITLGTIPDGLNYIDVRVRLTRSKDPYNFLDDPVPMLPAPNQWTHLPGGSCLVEATSIWRRLFEVVLVGQQVRLRRRQSVAPAPPVVGFTITDNRGYGGLSASARDPWGHSTYSRWGWTHGGANWQSGRRGGHPAAHIQTKNYSANSPSHGTPTYGAKHIRRANRCSLNNSHHDFSSTYSADIVIRPGLIRD